MKKVVSFSLLLLFVLAVGSFKPNMIHAQASFDVEKAIAAGDHKGLADYYKSQAEAQRKIVDMHKKMKKNYSGNHAHYKGYENVLAGHCGSLQFQAEKMAEQYDALAAQEEKLVK